VPVSFYICGDSSFFFDRWKNSLQTKTKQNKMVEHDDILDDDLNHVGLKERHGCVTVWLVFMIIGDAIMAAIYFFFWGQLMDMIPEESLDQMPDVSSTIMGVLVVLNLIFAVLMLTWKKIGFWGVAATTVLSTVLNISGGMDATQAVKGLFWVILLFGILQIPKNDVSAWKNME